MTKDEDFKLLKIQTWVLKVNIHCDGCKHKVKKLLQKIEGVYTVNIDAENQKVSVSGTVDSATLIKKLVRSGKHAELWSQKGNQMQKSQPNFIRDEKNMKDQKLGLIKDLKNLKTQQKFQTFSSDEDDDDEDDDEEDEEEEFRFLRERAAKVGLLRQINEVNAKKKNAGNSNVGVVSGGNSNGGKKGCGNGVNQNQNGILKSPGGDQKTNIAANKNVSFAHSGGVSNNEGKQVHEMNGMGHGLGFHGSGFQAQHNNFQAPGFPQGYGNGYQHPSAMMNMNRQNMNDRYMQQMMYHNRSPVVPSNVGYHHYQPYPHPHPHHNQQYESVEYASHMFSDENTGSCSIM